MTELGKVPGRRATGSFGLRESDWLDETASSQKSLFLAPHSLARFYDEPLGAMDLLSGLELWRLSVPASRGRSYRVRATPSPLLPTCQR